MKFQEDIWTFQAKETNIKFLPYISNILKNEL
jgi:hypothetical protein